MEQILLAQLDQARRNMSQAAFDEDYSEAAVWMNKIEALEDVLAEAGVHKQADEKVQAQGFNVVDIHG
ncbi:hypothetical protein [Pseudomonas phage GP100]|nr:hypothetical protein [Pseudomonas phage GP100]